MKKISVEPKEIKAFSYSTWMMLGCVNTIVTPPHHPVSFQRKGIFGASFPPHP